MKRLGNLFDSVCEYGTLAAAFFRVRRGRSRRSDVERFEKDLHGNLSRLGAELAAGTFRFGGYHLFKVFDPKERVIAAARVEDRVVHHALIALCGERLERSLVENSFACRTGRGQWKALEKASALLRRHPWCLKLDMRKYFDSIDHDLLLALLSRKIKDARVLELFRNLLGSYETAPGRGLPIGNLTSQYFANLYLDPLDRFIAVRPGVAHVRYMDDLLVFGPSETLRNLRREAVAFARDRLRLEIKNGGALHRAGRGVDFLGARLSPGSARFSRRSRLRFLRKLRNLEDVFATGKIDERAFQERLTALFAFAAHLDTLAFRRKAVAENEQGLGLQPAHPRGQLQQQCAELPLRGPQQQRPVQQQQQRVPAGGLACSSVRTPEEQSNRSFSGSRPFRPGQGRNPRPALVGCGPKTTRRGGGGWPCLPFNDCSSQQASQGRSEAKERGSAPIRQMPTGRREDRPSGRRVGGGAGSGFDFAGGLAAREIAAAPEGVAAAARRAPPHGLAALGAGGGGGLRWVVGTTGRRVGGGVAGFQTGGGHVFAEAAGFLELFFLRLQVLGQHDLHAPQQDQKALGGGARVVGVEPLCELGALGEVIGAGIMQKIGRMEIGGVERNAFDDRGLRARPGELPVGHQPHFVVAEQLDQAGQRDAGEIDFRLAGGGTARGTFHDVGAPRAGGLRHLVVETTLGVVSGVQKLSAEADCVELDDGGQREQVQVAVAAGGLSKQFHAASCGMAATENREKSPRRVPVRHSHRPVVPTFRRAFVAAPPAQPQGASHET